MDQTAKQQPVTFGGEQDFHIQFVLSIYWCDMMDGKSAGYYEHDNWPTDGPEWVFSWRVVYPNGSTRKTLHRQIR